MPQPAAGPSPLQLLVAAVLAGAQAAVRAGLDSAAPADPGRAHAEQVARWLGEQARGFPPAPAGPLSTTPARAGPAADELSAAFAPVLEAFRADERVARQLGGPPAACPRAVGAAQWREFWLACLRLDASLAAQWRGAGREAAALAMAAGEPAWSDLPASPGTPVRVLLPPAPALGVTGIRERPGAPPDPALGVVAAVPEAASLAQRVLALLDADAGLCHALEGLEATGIRRLSEGTAAAEFSREIRRRLRAAARPEAGRADRLLALYELDEAVCSAVHQPPAHPDSWWGDLAAASRRLLRQAARDAGQAGAAAEVRALDLRPYADLRGYTSDRNIAYRVPRDQVGLVLACLRTWLELDGEVHPGRVIWGSE